MKAVLRKAKSVTAVSKPVLIAALAGLVAGCVLMWLLGGLFGFGRSVAFDEEELNNARWTTRNASAALAGFLGYDHNGQGWRQYLRFDDLQRQLADGVPHSQADRAVLKDVVARLHEPHQGLEMRQFVSLRTALSTYLKMLSVSATPSESTADADRVANQERVIR